MMSLIFIPILASELGASYIEVGMIVSGFGAAMFISSFMFGKAADKHSFKTIIKLGLGVSAIAYFLQVLAYDPVSLAAARIFAGFSTGMYPAAIIAYVHTR
ncbi:MAG: MFS transporter, partial [Methanosarcinales archaeon]|nr:MFS transporter [Methanosarcinales archaeon]